MKLINDIKDNILKYNKEEQKCLLAFSAGPDSVFLLEQLHLMYKDKLKEKIALAYVNYHDSKYVKEEESIVNHYTKKYGLTLYKADTRFPNRVGYNFEDWAREYRYKFFAKVIKENGFFALYTAHQKTDVVETYLLQKKRGNLPLYYGLNPCTYIKGIRLIRPMLSITKEELEDILNKENIIYYDDITNKNLEKARNEIRSKLTLKDIDDIEKEIKERNNYLSNIYKGFEKLQDAISFSYYDNLSKENKQRLCFYLLSKKNIKGELSGIVKNMISFLNTKENAVFKINKAYNLYKTSKKFIIYKNVSSFNYSFTFKRKMKYKKTCLSIDLKAAKLFNVKSFPVEIRSAKRGDKISTNIISNDVYNFLKKQGIPSYLLHLYPVFVVDNKIKYVPFIDDIKENVLPFSFTGILDIFNTLL